MGIFTKNKKIADSLHGSRVEMVEYDGWADIGWIGTVTNSDQHSAYVKWDNGKRLSHMRQNLRVMSVTEGHDPNFMFKIYKGRKR